MSSAPVNPEIAEKLQANCTEPGIERNCLVCKAAIFLEERGKWKDRFLLVTQCCLYIFTVKQVEKTKKPKKTDKMKPETLSLFDLTEVNVDSTEKADEIVIKFRSQQDLERIYSLLSGGSQLFD